MMDMFVKNSIKRLQNCCDDKDADNCEATNSNKDNHKMQEKTKNEKVTVKHVPARSTCVPGEWEKRVIYFLLLKKI